MSDQLKPRLDHGQRMTLSQDQQPQPQVDDDEMQMRRALGLFGGGSPRPRPEAERQEPASRPGGNFMQGMHRRRFVQDGEVPVTVVRRDDAAATPQAPQSSRLQRVEAALAAETAARERAERALQEAQTALQTLQTKIGHNELAKTEALNAAKRDREEVVSLRDELTARAARIQELEASVAEMDDELGTLRADLAEERRARKLAERLAAEMTEERDLALDPVPSASRPAGRRAAPVTAEVVKVPARRGRPPLLRAVPEPEPEAEPVKWWLAPEKVAGKRR